MIMKITCLEAQRVLTTIARFVMKLWSYESVGYLQISPESMRKDMETVSEVKRDLMREEKR